jgi:hypothetical protein
MFVQAVREIDKANALFAGLAGIVLSEGIDHRFQDAFIAFGFDGGGAIVKASIWRRRW